MTIIDRRAMLKSLLGATVVATTGLVLVPDQANSAPLPLVTSDVVTSKSRRKGSVRLGPAPAPQPSSHDLLVPSWEKGMQHAFMNASKFCAAKSGARPYY